MKHYINFLILIVLFQVNEATSQSIYFERTYDTLGFYYANCIKQLPEGGYIFCGSNYSISNAQDAAIAKIDSSGNVVWAKVFGGQNTDGAISIELCNDSTYFVFGIRDNISPQQSDIWVLKLDQNGDTLYTKSILLGAGANVVRGSVATNDGGYALIGNTDTRGYGMNDFSLIKLRVLCVSVFVVEMRFFSDSSTFSIRIELSFNKSFFVCSNLACKLSKLLDNFISLVSNSNFWS